MSTPDEVGFWTKAATWAAGGAATLVGIVWGDMKYKVRQIESSLATKADKEEMDRNRDNVAQLFDKLEEHARRSEDRFDKVTTLINNLHRETMDKLDRKQDKRR